MASARWSTGTETYTNRTSVPIAVLTGPAGQTTLVAPGQSTTVAGRLQRLDIFTVNLSRRQLVGWDFAAHQTARLGDGQLSASAGATYTDKIGSAYDAQTPLLNYAGVSGAPRWRGRAAVDWTRRRWSFGTTMAYTASSGYHTPDNRYQKPYRVVHLRAGYTAARDSWLRGVQLNLGVDDIFNETPPLFLDPPIAFNYSAIPRPQGRFWRASVKRTW